MERFREYLLLLARARIAPDLQGRIDPSDVVQQTLLVAVEKGESYRGRSDAEAVAWLRAILANEIGMALRRLSRHPGGPPLSIEAELEDSSAKLAAILATDATPPAEALERTETLLRFAAAMARLPEDQRIALELRHLRGLPVVEVARAMDRSVPAVTGLLHRGTKTLRQNLADSSEG